MNDSNRRKPNIEAAYSDYADLLYRVALAQLANAADAQDAVQDVFIKYMTKAPVFADKEHERAWLLRVTVNRCHDIARREKKRHTLPLEDALGLAAEEQGRVTTLLETLAVLPAKYKDAVILHYLEGFSQQETADILHISLSAVKMRISRARAMLGKIRQEENDVP